MWEFKSFFFNKTALYYSVENYEIEIIKLLLKNKKTDPNIKVILINILNKIYIFNILILFEIWRLIQFQL